MGTNGKRMPLYAIAQKWNKLYIAVFWISEHANLTTVLHMHTSKIEVKIIIICTGNVVWFSVNCVSHTVWVEQ